MPIFSTQLRKIDFANPQEALKEMANHIRYIQEQLEYTLMNLDSSNITEIDAKDTVITSGGTQLDLGGTGVSFSGPNGETFEAGLPTGETAFRFTLKGKNGEQILYMDSNGQLVITNKASIHVDGGEW